VLVVWTASPTSRSSKDRIPSSPENVTSVGTRYDSGVWFRTYWYSASNFSESADAAALPGSDSAAPVAADSRMSRRRDTGAPENRSSCSSLMCTATSAPSQYKSF
jgi:hypothetical protein